MGLVTGEWAFAPGAAPGLASIAEELRRSTQLEVTAEGAGRAAMLSIPKLGESLFDWQIGSDRITVCGFVPAHPYLWEQLDAVLGALGGRRIDSANGWRPVSAHAAFRRPWTALTLLERFILRLPPVAAHRPFDRLLTCQRSIAW